MTINRLYHRQLETLNYNPRGIDIFSEDWDNLLILDACRYDIFSDLIRDFEIAGETESRISRASTSEEFIRANFTNRTLNDVVYVSANLFYPMLEDEIESKVHKFVNVHEREGWDTHPTYPEIVTRHARKAAKEYPDKRLLVHYMQPHSPYIGETGRECFGIRDDPIEVFKRDNPKATIQTLRASYEENLRIILDHLEESINEFRGKTIISADHGEFLGERSFPAPVKDVGHMTGVYTDQVTKVPWHIFEDGNRKQIREETSNDDMTDMDQEKLNDRLAALGYR